MPIAAAARSRWKKKFSFGLHHHHQISNSAPCSPSPSSVGVGIGIREPPPPPTPTPTPMSFICPISSYLMFDPVIIPTGHTFERACIEACREFNFIPPSLTSSSIDFSSSSSSSSSFLLIPNGALRAAIIDWCDHFAIPHPSPLSQDSARSLVQNLILSTNSNSNSNFLQQEDYSTTTNNNQNKQQNHQPSSSSSSCYSYPSSSSTSSFSSSDIRLIAASTTSSSSLLVDVDPKTHKSTATADPTTTTTTTTSSTTVLQDSEAEAILVKLKNPQISVKESGVVTLRHFARETSQRRISLCTPRLLSALVPMILSTNSTIQVNATAALVNLSIEPANKVMIVRSGAVPPLVDALRSTNIHSEEARYNAAGALFSLALEDENKLAIGVLGAIPPLVNLFCQAQQQQQSEFARAGHEVACVEAGMALYHLSLAPNNLSKIAKTAGAVKSILTLATVNANADDTAGAVKGEIEEEEGTIRLRLRRVAMMLLASLARRNEGRVALMDADAIKAMVGMMKEGAAGREEYCLAVMYEMSKGSLRFRALARAAGAERVLMAMAGNDNMEGRGEVGKEMARRTLKVIRGDEEKGVMLMLGDEYDNEEEVGSVVSDGLVSFRRRYDDFGGISGANSANF